MPRPRISDNNYRLHVVLSDVHKAALGALAAQLGLTESDVVRLLIVKAQQAGGVL
jgi:antitoxin component of RelBE/YafQ-DinJ toxin-antitoxin module